LRASGSNIDDTAALFVASIDELTVFEKANQLEANFKSPPNAKLREVCAKDGDEIPAVFQTLAKARRRYRLP